MLRDLNRAALTPPLRLANRESVVAPSSVRLFDSGVVSFAERVVLAEIVVPEPLAGI
jgi:hypothetical protein